MTQMIKEFEADRRQTLFNLTPKAGVTVLAQLEKTGQPLTAAVRVNRKEGTARLSRSQNATVFAPNAERQRELFDSIRVGATITLAHAAGINLDKTSDISICRVQAVLQNSETGHWVCKLPSRAFPVMVQPGFVLKVTKPRGK